MSDGPDRIGVRLSKANKIVKIRITAIANGDMALSPFNKWYLYTYTQVKQFGSYLYDRTPDMTPSFLAEPKQKALLLIKQGASCIPCPNGTEGISLKTPSQ